jgi:hypothetical protein
MQITDYEKFLRDNVPMIDFSGLSIVDINEAQCVVKMPFAAQNKNHVQSMYLGSLVIGAEVSAGILAFHLIHANKVNSTVVFKSFNGSFLKLVKGDAYFICKDAAIIRNGLKEASTTQQRVNVMVRVIAVEDLNNLSEPVATFEMAVSMKQT